MNPLLDGILRFQRDVFPHHQRRFEALVQGQKPPVLFVTCSDSRIDPSMITQSSPGELFIVRNAGNIVPPWGSGDGSTAAALEYAVEMLHVTDIVVCGHMHCGAITTLVDGSPLTDLPAVEAWLRLAEPTKRILKRTCSHLAGEALVNRAIEHNALHQLANLRTHPAVAARLSEGTLRLHAWVYDFGAGEVHAYDAETDSFVRVQALAVEPAAP